MYVCTSRPNLGHSASARTKNKGKDWEEPLLRSSSCGLLMLMAAFQAAICVCVAGKGLGRGDQQGEGCMYVCMYVRLEEPLGNPYIHMYRRRQHEESSRKPCLRCQRPARVATPNPFSTPFAFSGFSHRPSSRKGAKWH